MFQWLNNAIEFLVENALHLSLESHWGSAIHFFFFDTIKILILLMFMVFFISYIQTYFPPEKVKEKLAHLKSPWGNALASLFGIITPFCSCSSVPLFIGFTKAQIPVGMTFSFLITSPLVNEAVIAILISEFGLKFALIYAAIGILVGILGGMLIGKIARREDIEPFVFEGSSLSLSYEKPSQKARLSEAKSATWDVVKRIWIFLLIGIGIGAVVHGWVPGDFLARIAGEDRFFAVPVATILGVPLYSNALGMIPVAQSLMSKGMSVGAAMSLMMAVTALSLPEFLLLRKVIKPRLLFFFALIVTLAIMLTGYLFNLISPFLGI